MNQPKILLFDIETAPNLGYYFELYREGNIVWNEKNWYIMSIAWKWLGQEEVQVKGLPDFPTYYKNNKEDDKELLKLIHELFDSADIIIAHNGDEFDIKKVNARFAFHGMKPPAPYKSIDTKKVAKKYFKFDSNKLTDLSKFFGLGEKIDTGGYELWADCMRGDVEAWSHMKEYNAHDVVLLEKVYLELRPWITNHPNLNIISGTYRNCPNCGKDSCTKEGWKIGVTGKYQRYKCKSCGAWSHGETIPLDDKPLRS